MTFNYAVHVEEHEHPVEGSNLIEVFTKAEALAIQHKALAGVCVVDEHGEHHRCFSVTHEGQIVVGEMLARLALEAVRRAPMLTPALVTKTFLFLNGEREMVLGFFGIFDTDEANHEVKH